MINKTNLPILNKTHNILVFTTHFNVVSRVAIFGNYRTISNCSINSSEILGNRAQ